MSQSADETGSTRFESFEDFLKNTLTHTGSVFSKCIFELMAPAFPEPFIRSFAGDILEWASKANLNVSFEQDALESGENDAGEILTDLFNKTTIRKMFEKSCITAYIHFAGRIKAGAPEKDKRLREIQKIFRISGFEIRLVNLFYLAETDARVDRLVSELNEHYSINNPRYMSNLNETTISILLGCRRADVRGVFSSDSALVRSRIMDDDRDLSREIQSFLDGLNDKPILHNYFTEYDGPYLPPENFFISAEEMQIMLNLFRCMGSGRGVNILLHGRPGTGKTEFARSLSAQLGVPLFVLRNNDQIDKDEATGQFRIRAFTACQNMVDHRQAVVLIDEADTLLNSIPRFFIFKETTEKGLINTLLDQSRTFNVWIVNYPDGMDESTLRRFDYILEFKPLIHRQRMRIWQILLKKTGMTAQLSAKQISQLAESYELSAGHISRAIKNASGIYRAKSATSRFPDILETFLKSYSAHKSGVSPGVHKRKIQPAAQFILKGLNTDTDLDRVLSMIRNFSRQTDDATGEAIPRTMNLLLYGPSGTGKTEFAKYLAGIVNRKLWLKTSADLLSHWVGMTEKNIREAFHESSRQNGVLFFDEIDSLLLARGAGMRSWEVSQVNELLTCMEQYDGIFLAATNHKELIDHAAMRRFNLKIRFDYLQPEGVMIFYRRYFSDLVKTRLRPAQKKRLTGLNFLTPGDFRVVREQFHFHGKVTLSHDMLIDALRAEIRNKSGTVHSIGFH